jgi:hypothetical protein
MPRTAKLSASLSVKPAARSMQSEFEYVEYLTCMANRVTTALTNEPVFETDAADLWNGYLYMIPYPEKAHHTCRTCQRFVERYGGLVTIRADGSLSPVLWDPATSPDLYYEQEMHLHDRVRNANVTGVFISADSQLGVARTGRWSHLHGYVPEHARWKKRTQTASQASAEKLEEFKMLDRALVDFSSDTIKRAQVLVASDELYRTEKVAGPMEFFADLKAQTASVRAKGTRANLIWRAVATAPAGFAHIRSTMVGSLLEDLQNGYSTDQAKSRFAAKMHPLRYQRPKAAPASQTIQRAEKLVAELGLERSFARRYARLEEVPLLWAPKQNAARARKGVFANVVAKNETVDSSDTLAGKQRMTWTSFHKKVVPLADSMEVFVPTVPAAFFAVLGPVHMDAPLLFQWSHGYSWYTYTGGSYPSRWNLSANTWAKVTGLCKSPAHWYDASPNQAEGTIFILQGARDTQLEKGLAIFPETLRSELHEVRSVIEAHSANGTVQGAAQASVCGLLVGQNTREIDVRVDMGGVVKYYTIDRWE